MAQGTGVRVRHQRSCGTERGFGCTCKPSYEAWAYVPRDRKKIRETFPTRAAARAWRACPAS